MLKKIANVIIIAIICINLNCFYYQVFGETETQAVQKNYTGPQQNELRNDVQDRLNKSSVNNVSSKSQSDDTVDSIMQGAKDFLSEGQDSIHYDETKLKKVSNLIFNILLAIAIAAAVIVGMVIGVKFMVSSIEEKAKIKEALVPYVAGCVVVFAAFGIWKLAVTILSTW
jgi:hypothetical protein